MLTSNTEDWRRIGSTCQRLLDTSGLPIGSETPCSSGGDYFFAFTQRCRKKHIHLLLHLLLLLLLFSPFILACTTPFPPPSFFYDNNAEDVADMMLDDPSLAVARWCNLCYALVNKENIENNFAFFFLQILHVVITLGIILSSGWYPSIWQHCSHACISTVSTYSVYQKK